MQQHEFIWITKNICKDAKVTQDDIGNTYLEIRPQIRVSHNYKKKNLMVVEFLEDGAKHIIPTRKALEDILKLHLTNENLGQILRKYSMNNLERV